MSRVDDAWGEGRMMKGLSDGTEEGKLFEEEERRRGPDLM
jgi:hypothetical protein